MVERSLCMRDVAGSIPVTSKFFLLSNFEGVTAYFLFLTFKVTVPSLFCISEVVDVGIWVAYLVLRFFSFKAEPRIYFFLLLLAHLF